MSIPSYHKNSILPGTKPTTRLVDRFEKTYILFEAAILTYLPIAWLKNHPLFKRLLEEKCLYKVQAASLTDFQGPGEKKREKESTAHIFLLSTRTGFAGFSRWSLPFSVCHLIILWYFELENQSMGKSPCHQKSFLSTSHAPGKCLAVNIPAGHFAVSRGCF